jgi:parvulin-like peptidyl-prolyl isomerase
MSFESDPLEEPKDRTKLMWLGVLALLAGVIIVLWVANQKRADISEVRAKHILIKCRKDDPVDRTRALELITDLRTRLRNGESFSKLAKEFSNDETSAARGGDLGYYPKGSFEPAFEEYVWNGPIGVLSDIIQTAYGFHLVIVLDRHQSKADAYEMELERKAREGQKPSAMSETPSGSR